MNNIGETKSKAPSAADELQSVVDDILSGTTLADTNKTIAAAEALIQKIFLA